MESNKQEQDWIEWLGTLKDPHPALRAFSKSYHYFSLHQVIAFARLFQAIPFCDRKSLAMLADVLHEELGRGSEKRVHSVLFERFAAAVGVDVSTLPLAEADVLPGVLAYVHELETAFGGKSLPYALATYQFLESSAVETYGPLLARLRSLGFSEDDLEFFALHAEVEVEHAQSARDMVERQRFTTQELEQYHGQLERLQGLWNQFWSDIISASRQAISHATETVV